MTLANAKRLHKFYMDTGQKARAKDLEDKRPELKAAPTPKAKTK